MKIVTGKTKAIIVAIEKISILLVFLHAPGLTSECEQICTTCTILAGTASNNSA